MIEISSEKKQKGRPYIWVVICFCTALQCNYARFPLKSTPQIQYFLTTKRNISRLLSHHSAFSGPEKLTLKSPHDFSWPTGTLVMATIMSKTYFNNSY